MADIPAYHSGTVDLLRCAFPDGISPEAYFPLLAVLIEHMSFRSVARVISYVSEKSYEEAYHDALRADSTDKPGADAIETIKQALTPCGYLEWLEADLSTASPRTAYKNLSNKWRRDPCARTGPAT